MSVSIHLIYVETGRVVLFVCLMWRWWDEFIHDPTLRFAPGQDAKIELMYSSFPLLHPYFFIRHQPFSVCSEKKKKLHFRGLRCNAFSWLLCCAKQQQIPDRSRGNRYRWRYRGEREENPKWKINLFKYFPSVIVPCRFQVESIC